MNKHKEPEKSVSIRFPLDLLEEVKETAQNSERSMNGEVLVAVREHIARLKKSKNSGAHENV